MKPALMKYLCCPHDGAAFALTNTAWDGPEIESGSLVCSREPRHRYPILRGIPRIIDNVTDETLNTHYAESFGYQWTRLAWEDPTANEHEFWSTTGFDSVFLKGKVFLDAGCGGGRTTSHLPPLVKEVVYLDYSVAVERAKARCGRRPNAHFVQASLEAPPLRRGMFDVVFCNGVLHHTPDTRKTFDNLPGLVRPGGCLHVYVFRRAAWPAGFFHWTDHTIRRCVSRMPRESALAFCRAIGRLADFRRLRWLKRLIWFSQRPDPQVRLAHNHDWYACRYHHEHTVNEVIGWFTEHGFRRIGYTNGWPDAPPEQKYVFPGRLDSQRLGLTLTIHGFKPAEGRTADAPAEAELVGVAG